MISKKEAVQKHLKIWRSQPFSWGDGDCLTRCASYVADIHGIDPATGIRGTYSSSEGAQEHIDRAGGVAALVGQQLEGLGFEKADPVYGDIVVVQFGEIELGGICLSDKVAMSAEAHLIEVPIRFVKVIAAWRI